MLMADTMAIFFTIVGILLSFIGLWLLFRGLWPNAVSGASEVCRQGLIKPFLIGLPFVAAAFLALTLMGKAGPAGKFAAAAFICLVLVIANCGVAGLAAIIGERLGGRYEKGDAWHTTIRGGIPLALSFLPPILGWFVILPFTLTIGFGAFLVSIFKKQARSVRTTEELEAAEFVIK